MNDYRAEGVLESDKGQTRQVAKQAAIDAERAFAKLIGAAIRKRRIEIGCTREKLADLSFCHESTIEYLEAGTIDPTLSVLRRVLGALELDLQVSG